MTNSNLTEIVLVVDRSGSMERIKNDAEGGINSFIQEQKLAKGKANFTLCQFDTEYEFVFNGTPIENVKPYQLVPRGSTALNDAIGRTINETGKRLSDMQEHERPGTVIFMVVTDGEENASVEFAGQKVKEMIEHQKNVYNWKFIFIGSDESTIGTADSLGFNTGVKINTFKMAANYKKLSDKVSSYRGDVSSGISSEDAYARNMIYSEQDKKDLE